MMFFKFVFCRRPAYESLQRSETAEMYLRSFPNLEAFDIRYFKGSTEEKASNKMGCHNLLV